MENGLKPGPISENDLMMRLVSAKKIMNKEDGVDINTNIPRPTHNKIQESKDNLQNKKVVDVDKINKSRLPDVIKNAMIENPIPTISLNDTIDMSFLDGAKRIFEREGLSTKQNVNENKETKRQTQTLPLNETEIISRLTPIIENIIRKSFDEILKEKVDYLLSINQSVAINENLVLKVGDSVFKGKITTVNKSK